MPKKTFWCLKLLGFSDCCLSAVPYYTVIIARVVVNGSDLFNISLFYSLHLHLPVCTIAQG